MKYHIDKNGLGQGYKEEITGWGVCKGYYVNGKKNGIWNYYNKVGKILEIRYYKSGEIIKDESYYDNGLLELERKYKIKKGQTVIRYKSYYENGQLLTIAKMKQDSSLSYNLHEGNYIEYYKNRKVKKKGKYKDDKQIGIWKE